MIRLPPRSTRTDTPFPTRRSSDVPLRRQGAIIGRRATAQRAMENESLDDGPCLRRVTGLLTACANLQAPTNSAMAILSDRWIREAARTQGMIEPFEIGRAHV